MLMIWNSNFITREWKKDLKEENNFQRLRPTVTIIYILYLVKRFV